MFSEILNALLLTYLATEYLVASSHDLSPTSKHSLQQRLLLKQNLLLFGVVAMLNVLERVSGAAVAAANLLNQFLHLPKILFAAAAYLVALFIDCRRCSKQLTVPAFLRFVGIAFLRFLPIYPLLAVFISFGFLILINLFEFLHLPLEALNWPIYYGTLYGPFSLTYWTVKNRIATETTSLPYVVTRLGSRH